MAYLLNATYKRTQNNYSVNRYVAAAAAKSLQLCPTLCDPIDGSPPGSPVIKHLLYAKDCPGKDKAVNKTKILAFMECYPMGKDDVT